MTKPCMGYNHYHIFIIGYNEIEGFYKESEKCSECQCPKAIVTNLEYLEYKYEKSIS